MSAKQNLLCGILALQNNFISRAQLLAGFNAWVEDKRKSLADLLLEQEALSEGQHALLIALTAEHLRQHGDDADESLAALGAVGSARKDLEQIADPEVHASLDLISKNRSADEDPYATRAVSVGVATSSGLRFKVLRPHAKGGLGEVFVARDTELNREVALKQIQSRHADQDEARSRFLLEAEITGRLEHPGIVPVYGLGQYADGRPFYAMRFIKGDSLKEAIAVFHRADVPGRDAGERTLALRKLLGRFIDVCNAIAYAHSRGVLHRDLKPGNIMLGQYGETLVVDWGLAKAVGSREDISDSKEPTLRPTSASGSPETVAGSAIGTPAYMSPEQAAGRLDLLGPASDVYSLGATLYCLLTGQPPFESTDVGVMLQRVQKGDFPPPRQMKPNVPVALEAICKKAMALRPEDRYSSVRALADDVEHWLADEPVRAWPEPWHLRTGRWMRRHKPLVSAAAAAILVGLVTSTAGILWHHEEQNRRTTEQKLRQTRDEFVARTVAYNIQGWIEKHRSALEDLAKRQEFVAALLKEDPEALCNELVVQYQKPRRYNYHHLLDNDNHLCYWIANRTGRILAVYPKIELPDKNYQDCEWFNGIGDQRQGERASPLQRWHIAIQFQFAAFTKRRYIAVSTPVKAESGNIVGVLVIAIRMDILEKWVSNLDEPDRFPVVLNNRLQYLYHRDMDKLQPDQGLIPALDERHVLAQQLLRERKAGILITPFRDPLDQKTYLASYAPVEGSGWWVVIQRLLQ